MTELFSPDTDREVTVSKVEQPELYELADDAQFDGNHTFTYKGRLWEVGEGVVGAYWVIRPKVPNE
jgi:hypothetical protein